MEALNFTNSELIPAGCIMLFFIIQISFYFFLYNRIYRRSKAVQKDKLSFSEDLPPISVIICANDELINLQKFLPSILEQDYPQFEVIVINDSSSDESDEFLTLLEDKYENLYHSFTPSTSLYISHKKLAVTLGVKASKYDWLVLTEPNCRPASPNWLRLMARNFTPGTEIVLGHSGYEKGYGWLNQKISFDSLFTSMRTLGLALAGKPYTGCGRNMAYRKELFYSSKAFSTHLNLLRGEDDLFVNQTATRTNTKIETDADAVMWMKPLSHKKPWREDKLNNVVTSGFYKGGQRYLLGSETLSRFLFYAAMLGGLVYGIIQLNYILIAISLLLWLIRYIIQAVIINKTAKSLGDKERFYLSLPILDFLHPIQSFTFKMACMSGEKRDFMRKL